jgi:CheY-like chemotaxis protein
LNFAVPVDDNGASGLVNNTRTSYRFQFNDVLPMETTQEDVFDDKLHFLLVEDNVFNVKVVKNFFRNDRHITCDVAKNGQEAVDMYKVDPSKYDLCIMDIQMPIMNGFDATRLIRQHEHDKQLTHLFILGLSADGMKETHTTAFKVGMDQFETKPIGKPQLLRFFGAHKRNLMKKPTGYSSSDSANEEMKEMTVHYLLVEDNAFNVKVMQSYFRHHGSITFDHASNGREAFELFKERFATYDLCIMDSQMAVMDGFESTRMIRKWEVDNGLEPTCILGLSADATTEAQAKARACGMTHFEAKPFGKQQLLRFFESSKGEQLRLHSSTGPCPPTPPLASKRLKQRVPNTL